VRERRKVREGVLSPEQHAIRQMEAEEPGLLKAKWGPNGEIVM
jgi:two-component system probable response regulator PhcQ